MNWGLLLRGFAMGLAEVVPGVSGGTIAFVSGIYDELVTSLARFSPNSLSMLWRKGITEFWRYHNLGFLLLLGAGMFLGIITFAQFIKMALATMPTVVWGFFFGVILCSIPLVIRQCETKTLLLLPVGAAMGWWVSTLTSVAGEPSLPLFFVGGAIAICAWLLPAVSGSFMLLILGLYEPLLQAITELQWSIVITVGVGCVVGLMVFSRVLAWLMHHYRSWVLALMAGFMAGALVRLWPWQVAGKVVTAPQYELLTQTPSLLPATLFATSVGIVAIWQLARIKH